MGGAGTYPFTSTEIDGHPLAPSGMGEACCSVCTAPVLSVARAVMVRARHGLPFERPQSPGVVGVRRTERRRLPGTVVDTNLDRLDATVLSPGDAADGDRARVQPGAVAGTSTRDSVLMGALADHPNLVQ